MFLTTVGECANHKSAFSQYHVLATGEKVYVLGWAQPVSLN